MNTEASYRNFLSAPDRLPKKLLLNVHHVRDEQKSLVSLFHPSIYWPEGQNTVKSLSCPEGKIFLYQSLHDKQCVNDWASSNMYITVLINNNPLQDGPPVLTLHMQADQAVELLSSNDLSDLYQDKKASKKNPNWSNENYARMWYHKAYPECSPLGYLPDPVSPRGCNRPIYNQPPSFRVPLRSQVNRTVSTISRTCKNWFAMGITCSPSMTSSYPLQSGGPTLQRAKCPCDVELLDGNMSAPFEVVTQQPKVTDVLNSLM